MAQPIQLNFFGSKRIDFNEQVQLTIDSLNTYGPLVAAATGAAACQTDIVHY